jgi:putative bacteriocin precursor, CLI_3235 family
MKKLIKKVSQEANTLEAFANCQACSNCPCKEGTRPTATTTVSMNNTRASTGP